MTNKHEQSLSDIADAVEFDKNLPINEVLDLLGITKENSDEEIVDILFSVSTNPAILQLSRDKRLAAIKTCQEVIGNLFKLCLS